MKLSIPRACGSWCKSPPVSTTLHKPISFYSSIPSSSPLKPQVPLFLRPPIHSATLSDLQKWHHWAKTLPVPHSDDPPDPTLLRRELKWLLEDALEVHSSVPQMGSHCDDRPIKLRTGLEQLYSVWRQRIEERRPFQYVVGCEHWRDLVLSVQDGVLIPRPETEVFVDLVGDVVTQNGDLTQGLWADLGTGSGAIAIGIGRILGPRGRVIATDLSPVAVSVASFNVQRYSLQVCDLKIYRLFCLYFHINILMHIAQTHVLGVHWCSYRIFVCLICIPGIFSMSCSDRGNW